MAGSVAEPRWQQLKDQSYSQLLVIMAAQSGPPTSAYCAQIRDQYSLTFPVLYDPTGQLKGALSLSGDNDHSVVLGAGGTIVYKQKYASQSTVMSNIQSELSN